MITFWTKSLLALPLVVMALVNLLTMLEHLGRPQGRFNPKMLRRTHRIVGWSAVALMLVLSYYCVVLLKVSGQPPTAQGALHIFTALAAMLLLFVKILCVRCYRKFFTLVPALGIAVFVLLMSTIGLSAGTYLLTAPSHDVHHRAANPDDLDSGRQLFAVHCQDCHYADRTETKVGPGLGGLATAGKMPASGRAVTPQNLLHQLNQPIDSMPSFDDLPKADKEALVRYLLSL